jgi:LysM repeat protein
MFKKALIIGLIVGVLGWLFASGVQAASPPGQGEGQEYVVQADDSLSQLAKKYLGEVNLWPQIVEATNARVATDPRVAVITNPNVIYPGQIIFIPTTQLTLPEVVEPEGAESSLDGLCQDRHPAVQAFCSEIPIARIHFDPYEEEEFFTCASRSGLANVPLNPNEVTILVPNDGDFDLKGITASIKVTQNKATLIPRWPGSRFDFSAEYAEKFELPAGEQLEISLSQAFELIKAGELVWTGQHGVPGKAGLFQTNPVLTCDPQAEFEIEIGPFNPKA